MKKLSVLDWVSMVLLIIGGLNWGLIGLLRLDLVNTLFGEGWVARAVYILVGVAAVYALLAAGKMRKQSEETPS